MENPIQIRLELGLSAYKFTQQVQIHSKNIESLVERGIEEALQEIEDEEGFVNMIKQQTKKELATIVNQSIMSWAIQDSIAKAIKLKIGAKIDLYGERVVEKIFESLNLKE